MRWIVILSLFLVACAGEKKQDPVVCVEDPSPVQYTYRDGQYIKSGMITCSNGCLEFYSLDSQNLRESTCQ